MGLVLAAFLALIRVYLPYLRRLRVNFSFSDKLLAELNKTLNLIPRACGAENLMRGILGALHPKYPIMTSSHTACGGVRPAI